MENVREHDLEITKYATEKLKSVEGVEIYGPEPEKKGAVISFNVKTVHPHDVSSILDSEGVAIRGGHHCAMPLMRLLGIQGSARASFYLYNTTEEVDVFVNALAKVRKILVV